VRSCYVRNAPARPVIDKQFKEERGLVSLCAALIGDLAPLLPAEAKLLSKAHAIQRRAIAEARAQILSGEDPLGAAFCALRSPGERRRHGATYTPAAIVHAMVAWAKDEIANPARIVDPGSGSGRFLVAAARVFREAQLVAVDVDPLATLMLRANAAVHGFASRLSVHLCDYRSLEMPAVAGVSLFVGNPPYVRHHEIDREWKAWFAATAKRFGVGASKLAGLHIHFFFRTLELAKEGDCGAFITAAEWLDVNYGAALRRLLGNGLGGTAVHIIEPTAQPFPDALTTGAITCFRVGARSAAIRMRSVSSLEDLSRLDRGRAIGWDEIGNAPKWSVFVRGPQLAQDGFIELGELFRVHRGQVTGANELWIDNEAARDVPSRLKLATVTSARELIEAGDELSCANHLRRVIDLPPDLDGLDDGEREAVLQFLAWVKQRGGHRGYSDASPDMVVGRVARASAGFVHVHGAATPSLRSQQG
ncbi:MAG TPA: N-6 DNA methylase, partial [Gammaproteobacteria bacterium]|nr:N-6 DNA methylase [Gammaproteobacteria bacterium]